LNISEDIGGCTINGQRCWKFGGFGHNRVMAAAGLQHMHRVFISVARASCRNDSARLEERAASNSGFTTFVYERI
jgi:hypothetical protein